MRQVRMPWRALLRTCQQVALHPRFNVGWRSLGSVGLAAVALASLACGSRLTGAPSGNQPRGSPSAIVASPTAAAGTLHDSVTHGGVTITLTNATADVNGITVAYRVQVPQTLASAYRSFSALNNAHLPDADGRAYGMAVGPSGEGRPDPSNTATDEVLHFDADPLPDDIHEVQLTLQLPAVTGTRDDDTRPLGQESTIAQGPWRFRFTVPVERGQDVQIDQPVTAAGVTLRLLRVRKTLSQVHAWLKLEGAIPGARTPEPDSGELWQWHLGTRLMAPGASQGEIGQSQQDLDTWEVVFPTPQDATSGTWTLQVTEMFDVPVRTRDLSGRMPNSQRLSGPWEFTFPL